MNGPLTDVLDIKNMYLVNCNIHNFFSESQRLTVPFESFTHILRQWWYLFLNDFAVRT